MRDIKEHFKTSCDAPNLIELKKVHQNRNTCICEQKDKREVFTVLPLIFGLFFNPIYIRGLKYV